MTITRTSWRRQAAATAALVGLLGIAAAASGPASADEQSHIQSKAHRLTGNQRAVLLDATHRFRDIDRAVAAGYQPTQECVPGMGYHYGHPDLVGDMNIDPTVPEILVYAPARNGSLRLAAVEYFRADADGDRGTDDDRPTLFGHPFDGPMDGHAVPPGAPLMPVHYDLHVWLYKHNPDGELNPENPNVHCP